MKSLILAILIYVFVCINLGSMAQESSKDETQDLIEIELLRIQQEYQNLKEQNQLIVDQLQNEREKHYEFVERTYEEIRLVFSIAIATSGIAIGFFGWKTSADIRQKIRDFQQDVRIRAEEEFNTVITQEAGDLRQKVEEIGQKAEDLRNELRGIDRVIDIASQNYGRRIRFVCNPEQMDSVENIINRLMEKGFQRIDTIQKNDVELDTAMSFLSPELCDLVIYICDLRTDSQQNPNFQIQDELLDRITGYLNNEDRTLPVIVYTKSGRVSADIMNSYNWILPTNTPITLMNGILNTSNIL